MSPTSSIPEDIEDQYSAPSTPQDDSDESQSYPPSHPVPSMQAAFEESMYEQGHPPPEPANPYAVATTVRGKLSAAARFKPKYHPLTKLVSQIAFGIHLLHKRLAKSDSEVVRILQAHVNDMDNFLSTTTRDFDTARADISTRIKNLKVPLEAGPASDVFENMLKDSGFRVQIIEGNKKVDFVIKRTAKAMNVALEDVGEGLRAVDELAKYLLTLKTGWRNANLMRVYGAMTHNVEGWFRCFVGLQMKGQVLGERLNALKMVVWEIERRCGRASRGSGRNALAVVKKRPSLNQIPENPSGEAADAIPLPKKSAILQAVAALEGVDEKPLPITPIPTPVLVVGAKDGKHKRHSSGDIIGSPPATPRRTLSKRRTSIAGLPTTNTTDPSNPIKAQKATQRAVETIVVLDHETGNLRRKRIHRRSATVHAPEVRTEEIKRPSTAGLHGTVTTTVTAGIVDSQAGTGATGGVLSSLRRSLSLGRSAAGRPRSRSRDGKAGEGKEDVRGRPPVPRLPATVLSAQERVNREEIGVKEADLTPPASRDSKAGGSEKSGHTGVAGAVKAGIASIKKRKSKAHLHHPSGHPQIPGDGDLALMPTPPSGNKMDSATKPQPTPAPPKQMRRVATAPMQPTDKKETSRKTKQKPNTPKPLQINTTSPHVQSSPPAVELPGSMPPSAQTQTQTQTPTTPRSKTRRNSSAISNLLSLRPKSRHATHAPTEPIPPMPVSVHTTKPQQRHDQTLTIKDSNVGNSAILASVRELQAAKKHSSAAVPAFKLQGGPDAGGADTLDVSPKDPARRVSMIGSTHTAASTSTRGMPHESGRKIPTPAVPAAAQQGKGKNSFLLRFFTDRAF